VGQTRDHKLTTPKLATTIPSFHELTSMTSNCELFFSHVFVSFGVGSTCLLLFECPPQLCGYVRSKQRSQKLKGVWTSKYWRRCKKPCVQRCQYITVAYIYITDVKVKDFQCVSFNWMSLDYTQTQHVAKKIPGIMWTSCT
jgi:hypothetical protein